MQEQYQLTFTTPLAPLPKKQNEEKLPDDLASLQTVCQHTLPQIKSPQLLDSSAVPQTTCYKSDSADHSYT